MRQILIIVLVCFGITTKAQHFFDKIPFVDFQKWVSATTIPEYKYYAAEKKGEAQYNEAVKYQATFIKEQVSRLNIYLEDKSGFASYLSTAKQNKEAEIFEEKGNRMVYIPLNAKFSSAFLLIKVKNIDACFVFHFVPLISKEEALIIYEKFIFSQLKKY